MLYSQASVETSVYDLEFSSSQLVEACLAKPGSIWPRHTWASYWTQGTPLIYSTELKHRDEGSPLMWVTGGGKQLFPLTESLLSQ